MGSSSMGGIGLPATPSGLPSLADQDIQLSRGSALRQISAKRGLASTFLTSGGSLNDTPTAATVPQLGAPGPFPALATKAYAPRSNSGFGKTSLLGAAQTGPAGNTSLLGGGSYSRNPAFGGGPAGKYGGKKP